MQEWVTVIIVLLIVAILLDGVRRMRIAQRDKIRMSRSIYKNSGTKTETAKEAYTSELPNGGARVIGSRGPSQIPREPKVSANKSSRREATKTPQQTRLNLDESVPLLMESVTEDVLLRDHANAADDESIARDDTSSHQAVVRQTAQQREYESPNYQNNGERIEPTFSATGNELPMADYLATDERKSEAGLAGLEEQDSEYTGETIGGAYPRDEEDYLEEDDYSEEDDYPENEYAENDYDDDEEDEGYYEDEEYSESDTSESAINQPAPEPEEVLIINVMAFKGETFNGAHLLDILLKCGMRYGDMNIFHRYSDAKGEGALLFSMANMVKPGTFDLDAMDQFETPGISLFMTLPLDADSMQSFDLMVDTARSISEALDGELKDEQRSVMTRQTIEHCRQRIRDFELKRLSRSRH